MFSGVAWLRRLAGWARNGVVVTVGAVAVLAAFAGAPPQAPGETGAPGGSGGAAGVWCSTLGRLAPASAGEPVELTPGVGSTQSIPAGRRFAIRLAVTVTDAEGNPVPGAPVTFSAPAGGPSGRFTTRTQNSKKTHARVSHPRSVTIRTGACGIAVAPAFTANDRRGGYIVKATVEHVRPAAFALVNEAPAPSS
jgi:hypothetical protein